MSAPPMTFPVAWETCDGSSFQPSRGSGLFRNGTVVRSSWGGLLSVTANKTSPRATAKDAEAATTRGGCTGDGALIAIANPVTAQVKPIHRNGIGKSFNTRAETPMAPPNAVTNLMGRRTDRLIPRIGDRGHDHTRHRQ